MRTQKDRRTPSSENDKQFDIMFQERRHLHDRRMENMSMEERQLQFSEMPSPDPHKKK